MPIPEGDRYLPLDQRMHSAFELARLMRPAVSKARNVEELQRIPLERLSGAIADYLTAGVAYLANRGFDDYIKEIGTVAWKMISRKRVLPVYTDNPVAVAVQIGVSPKLAVEQYSGVDEVYIIFAGNPERPEKTTGIVLLPPHFALRVNEKPIEALSTTAWMASQIRDLANGKIHDNGILPRASATESYFLEEALKQYPDHKLDPRLAKALEYYPGGLGSIPAELWYENTYE